MSKTFKMIDWFSGAGGMTLGFAQAGFEPILAVEKGGRAAARRISSAAGKDAGGQVRRESSSSALSPDTLGCQNE